MFKYNITYRKKDKGWQYIISRKEGVKWKQIKSKQGFELKSEAKPEAEKMLLEIKKNDTSAEGTINTNRDSVTFEELSEAYINHIKLYKEYNTIQNLIYAKAKLKKISDLKVKDIKKANIQKIVDDMIRKDLKVTTIKKYLTIIKMFFEYYKENYDLNYTNPVIGVKILKDKSDSTKKALTKSELDDLLEKLKEDKFYIVALIAATCGLRIGEVLGLTWNDIDEKRMKLSVNKQWKKNAEGEYDFGTLKSKNSIREVPLSVNTLKELKEFRDSNNVRQFNDRIVNFSNGYINKWLNKKLKEIKDITIHELRHTYATILISSGIDFKTAAKILGHDIEQTMRTYSHVTDDLMKNAEEKISKIF